MGQQHSHSHDGKPCHGHGEAANDHGHSHGGGNDHGHSHGGGNDHGHSHGAKPQQQQQHGHSHGGNDHGHSHGAKPQPQQQQQHGHSHGGNDHGHSHGAKPQQQQQQQHGHSHGGKPCHGHGGGAPEIPVPQTPEEVENMKKIKGVQLFLTQMVSPKVPIIWAHFHKNDARDESKATQSNGLTVPFVDGEKITRAEFHLFIEAFMRGQAESDGIETVRFVECIQVEMQLLQMLGFKQAVQDPEAEIDLGVELFKNLILNLIGRIAMSRYDAIPFMMNAFGLGAMKLPKLPQLSSDIEPSRIRAYSREKIMPLLIDFITANAETNKDSESLSKASGFEAATMSVEAGVSAYLADLRKTKLPADKQEDEDAWKQYLQDNAVDVEYVLQIDNEVGNLRDQAELNPEDVIGELRFHPRDKVLDPQLIAHNVQNLVVLPLLNTNYRCLQFIAKQWGIDLVVADPSGEVVQPPAA